MKYTLYHGTCPESADALCRNGWSPENGRSGSNGGQARYLYLTTDPLDALWFAEEKGCSTVVKVSDVPAEYLIVDPEDGMGETVEMEINNLFKLPGKLALTVPLSASHFSVKKDRLDEVTRPPSVDHAFDVLSKKGYRPVGSGWFSTIWAREGENSVLKIFSKRDVAYLNFVKLALDHQGNPHFPKFRGRALSLTNDFWAVRMEKLTPRGQSGTPHSIVVDIIDRFIDQKSMDRLPPYARNQAMIVFNDYPRLEDACLAVSSLVIDFDNDVHSDNIMWRNDIPVITDPLCVDEIGNKIFPTGKF